MHKCIPYANNNIFMMIRNWVLPRTGGTDKSVPYAHVGTYPIRICPLNSNLSICLRNPII